MRTLMTILITFSLLSNVVAQSLDKLDKINGFRKFKLGSNFSTFTNLKPEPTSIKLKDVTNFTYTGSDVSDFYGVPIEKVTLQFFKGKLYQIFVSFGTIYKEYRYDQFDLVQSNLVSNFGNDNHKVSPSPQAEILNGFIWDAKIVRLESLRLRFAERDGSRDPKFNYIQGYLLFTHKKLQEEQQSGELEN